MTAGVHVHLFNCPQCGGMTALPGLCTYCLYAPGDDATSAPQRLCGEKSPIVNQQSQIPSSPTGPQSSPSHPEGQNHAESGPARRIDNGPGPARPQECCPFCGIALGISMGLHAQGKACCEGSAKAFESAARAPGTGNSKLETAPCARFKVLFHLGAGWWISCFIDAANASEARHAAELELWARHPQFRGQLASAAEELHRYEADRG